jgi:uncharacterized phiE125 gp8 family phage protein
MTLVRTIGPSVEPVTLAEAKNHLRLTHASEDELVAGLIRAAREEVESATGVALINQSWRLTLDRWPRSNRILLLRHPVRSVTAVTVYGEDGEAAIVDPQTYRLDNLSRPARLHFEERPAPLRVMNGVELDFTAGFGEAGTDAPDLLKRAILLLVAHWFEFRGAHGVESQPVSYPAGYDRLIAGYRARRL